MCFPQYGEGDCSEHSFCGAAMGRGSCIGGLCKCAPGFCGFDCSGVVLCHVWDDARSSWSTGGVTTVAPALGSIATDGSIHCKADGVPASAFAGVCVPNLLDIAVLPPVIPEEVPPPEVTISPGTIATVLCLLAVTIADILTVRWSRQSRQKGLEPAERDPIWSPIIKKHTKIWLHNRWKWINRVDEITIVVAENLASRAKRLALFLARKASDFARMVCRAFGLARYIFLQMLRRACRACRLSIDTTKLNRSLASRRLCIDYEPMGTIGERAGKPRDRRLKTLRRTSEPAKWLPEFIAGTARVEALELLMLAQNKLGLTPEQLEYAATQIWTLHIKEAVNRIAAARRSLSVPLYTGRILEEDAPTRNGPIKEVINELQEEIDEQLQRSPTFAELDVQPLMDFPTGEGRMTAEAFKLVTLTEEYVAIGEMITRLEELVRVNEVNDMLAEVSRGGFTAAAVYTPTSRHPKPACNAAATATTLYIAHAHRLLVFFGYLCITHPCVPPRVPLRSRSSLASPSKASPSPCSTRCASMSSSPFCHSPPITLASAARSTNPTARRDLSSSHSRRG